MLKPLTIPAFALLCACSLTPIAAAQAPRMRPVVTPRVYLTWKAAYGDPRATHNVVANCADSTEADTLYLTIRSPRNVVPLQGITGTLLFEPQRGDTLGAFWQFERGARNAGNLLIDFDLLSGENCSSPWKAYVGGRVGYSHMAGRGRLDLTADVPLAKVYNIVPNECYFFARVTIRRKHGEFAGCRQPMRITLAGGKVRSSRAGSEDLSFALGPDQSVTWNAPPRGIRCRRTGFPIETWVPHYAPPSWSAMPIYPGAAHPGQPESE